MTPLEDSPGIAFTLARVRDDVTWAPSVSYPDYIPVVTPSADSNYVLTDDLDFVLSDDLNFVVQ